MTKRLLYARVILIFTFATFIVLSILGFGVNLYYRNDNVFYSQRITADQGVYIQQYKFNEITTIDTFLILIILALLAATLHSKKASFSKPLYLILIILNLVLSLYARWNMLNHSLGIELKYLYAFACLIYILTAIYILVDSKFFKPIAVDETKS